MGKISSAHNVQVYNTDLIYRQFDHRFYNSFVNTPYRILRGEFMSKSQRVQLSRAKAVMDAVQEEPLIKTKLKLLDFITWFHSNMSVF